MEKELIEHNVLIANRIPPGDKWELVIDKDTVIEGLVQTLTQYMRKTKFQGHYRLEPLNGKLFAIKEEQVEIPEPEPEVWDLYGEY
jgi:predicted RNA-binding protein with PUA domain|tara:strand:- start:542 stop:799 length:258 start_codon:yes stop_codon:yes gene_type:complete